MPNNEMLLQGILKILDDKKVVDIARFDMPVSSRKLSNSYVIASGTSARHMQSVADYVYTHLKKGGFFPTVEGNSKSGWMLIEASGIEIHLFKPELREYYNLEELLQAT
ncbi:MAG: ribosome silencing factor [Holosporales bacterium]|jgi:ribosome-associated protein|nr:ribosome silencing factor [Holosporales bacterium]